MPVPAHAGAHSHPELPSRGGLMLFHRATSSSVDTPTLLLISCLHKQHEEPEAKSRVQNLKIFQSHG